MHDSLEEILQRVVAASRQKAKWDAVESEAKKEFLLAYQMLQPDKALFIVKTEEQIEGRTVPRFSQVLAKKKTNTVIVKEDVVLALLGKRGHAILEPSVKKLWSILAKEPDLLAKMIATGAVSISSTDYAEVRHLDDKQPDAAAREGVAQKGVSATAH